MRSLFRLAVSLMLSLAPAIVLVVWSSHLFLWWLPLLWVAQMIGLNGLSHGAHEAVHNHLFYQRQLDRYAGRFMHGLLLLNHDVHRRYHLNHHAYLGTERDPEGAFDFNDMESVGTYWTRLMRWALPPSPMHILNWREGVGRIVGSPGKLGAELNPGPVLAGSIVPFAVAAALVGWLVTDPLRAVLGGLVPLLVLFPVYAYATSLPEHFGLADREAESQTRNILTVRPLQFLLWNINLHAVHHRSPHLHFSLLPGTLDKSPAPTANGYVRFHIDMLRSAGRTAGETTTVRPETLGVRP